MLLIPLQIRVHFNYFSNKNDVLLYYKDNNIKPYEKNDFLRLLQDIEEFINESEHGVIYFCLGSLLKTETMSEEKKNAFLYAFSRIAQKVLWKWGDDVLPGKTDKIFISKWMPQRDILGQHSYDTT